MVYWLEKQSEPGLGRCLGENSRQMLSKGKGWLARTIRGGHRERKRSLRWESAAGFTRRARLKENRGLEREQLEAVCPELSEGEEGRKERGGCRATALVSLFYLYEFCSLDWRVACFG